MLIHKCKDKIEINLKINPQSPKMKFFIKPKVKNRKMISIKLK